MSRFVLFNFQSIGWSFVAQWMSLFVHSFWNLHELWKQRGQICLELAIIEFDVWQRPQYQTGSLFIHRNVKFRNCQSWTITWKNRRNSGEAALAGTSIAFRWIACNSVFSEKSHRIPCRWRKCRIFLYALRGGIVTSLARLGTQWFCGCWPYDQKLFIH